MQFTFRGQRPLPSPVSSFLTAPTKWAIVWKVKILNLPTVMKTNFLLPVVLLAAVVSAPLALTQGDSVAPGQFQWMSWDGTGNTPYLCSILGPPANSPAYTVPANGFIVISGNTGVSNSSCVRGQASPVEGINGWVSLHATILVPIISPGPPPGSQTCVQAPTFCFANGTPYPAVFQGNGSNTTYNVIGFAGFQLTGCINPCIKNLQGVFRQAFLLGPTGSTTGTPGTPGGTLGIQLVR